MRAAPTMHPRKSLRLRFAVGAALLASAAGAQDVNLPPRPDTSGWKCENCPEVRDYAAEYSLGGSYVSDDSARFGNYTGYDEDGGYVFAEGTGRYIHDGYRMQWDLVDLGTDARAVSIEGGQPGVWEYRVGYDELPYRRFDDTRTIFAGEDEILSLPAGWVGGPTTGALSALNGSLYDRDIGSDRTSYEVGGEYRGVRHLQFSANYRRTERDGFDILGASFYNNAALLAAPFDDQTDTIDFAAAYTRDRWFVQLGWTGSMYDNSNAFWRWSNPFSAGGAAPAEGQIAQYPDNEAQVFTLSSAYHFPARTTLALSASMGEQQQDEALLSYSVNPALAPALPRQSFDGQVDTTHADLRLTSQPWSFLRLRALYRYDERDNGSSVNLWSRAITDLFASNDPEANRPYSFERERYGASAALRLDYWEWLEAFRFEAGYDRYEIDRKLQEAPDQTEDTAWGEVSWRAPFGAQISVKAGASQRDIDRYDPDLAALYEQNPLMRKYNLAYRFRDFAELRATANLGESPFALGAQAYYASDDYSDSVLGLRKADDRRFAADVTWTISEDAVAYLQGGYEDIALRTVNSESFGAPDWSSHHRDEFRTIGAGIDLDNLMSDRLGVRLNLLYAKGEGDIDVDTRFTGGGAFPQLETDLKSVTADFDYRLTDAIDLRLRLRYEDFESADWALQGVEPATIPQVLTLGADPYDYDVYLVTLAVRYSFGRPAPAPASEEGNGG